MEFEQFMNELWKKEEKRDLHISIHQNMTVVYNMEALKDCHQNKKVLKELHDEEYPDSTVSRFVLHKLIRINMIFLSYAYLNNWWMKKSSC